MQIEIRYVANADRYETMNPEQLRKSFVLDGLFAAGETKFYYVVNLDRAVFGSVVPTGGPIELKGNKEILDSDYLAERREVGVFNIGSRGVVIADSQSFVLENKETLYLGRGTQRIVFESDNGAEPAKFYVASYPAHASYPPRLVRLSDFEPFRWGEQKTCNKRALYQGINPETVQSCQLTMGCTLLDEGNVWNTFPSHLHSTRSEGYLYFNMNEEALVFHILGKPGSTRHVVVRNEEVALSPSWSIHSGVGTSAYAFLWAMGGENRNILNVRSVTAKSLSGEDSDG